MLLHGIYVIYGWKTLYATCFWKTSKPKHLSTFCAIKCHISCTIHECIHSSMQVSSRHLSCQPSNNLFINSPISILPHIYHSAIHPPGHLLFSNLAILLSSPGNPSFTYPSIHHSTTQPSTLSTTCSSTQSTTQQTIIHPPIHLLFSPHNQHNNNSATKPFIIQQLRHSIFHYSFHLSIIHPPSPNLPTQPFFIHPPASHHLSKHPFLIHPLTQPAIIHPAIPHSPTQPASHHPPSHSSLTHPASHHLSTQPFLIHPPASHHLSTQPFLIHSPASHHLSTQPFLNSPTQQAII